MQTMKLAHVISDNSSQIVSDWEEFARAYVTAANAMDIKGRRDHVEGMLATIGEGQITSGGLMCASNGGS